MLFASFKSVQIFRDIGSSQNGQFMSINPCIFRENRPRKSKLLFLSLVPQRSAVLKTRNVYGRAAVKCCNLFKRTFFCRAKIISLSHQLSESCEIILM